MNDFDIKKILEDLDNLSNRHEELFEEIEKGQTSIRKKHITLNNANIAQQNNSVVEKIAAPPPLVFGNREKRKITFKTALANAMFLLLPVFIAIFALLMNFEEKKSIFGYSLGNVLTNSMQSEIPQGSMLLIKHTDPNDLQIGDDITYKKDSNTNVSHRIISITENYKDSGERGFETQGTDNANPDYEIVPAVNVVGKVVWHIPRVGDAIAWFGEHLVLFILINVAICLIIILLRTITIKYSQNKNFAKSLIIQSNTATL